jgi:hypothetical protein
MCTKKRDTIAGKGEKIQGETVVEGIGKECGKNSYSSNKKLTVAHLENF